MPDPSRLSPEQARKLHRLEAGTATREELAEIAQLDPAATMHLSDAALTSAAEAAAHKLNPTAEDLGLGPYLPPSQDTPGLGGVPEPPDGITGQWISTADLHAAATREELEDLEDLEPSAECRLCAHVPEIDGPEPPLEFASRFCPIHGIGTNWRAARRAEELEAELKPYGNRGHWADPRCRLCHALRSEGHTPDCLANPAGLELPEGRVLRVVPGDVVMFAFPDSALIDIEAVNRAIEGILPDGVTALVLSDGVEVTRITADYATGYRDGYGHADNGLDAVIPEDTADAIAADAAPIADATADALRRRSRGTDPRFEAR